MAKIWHGLKKVTEECAELIVELMKLDAFPSGKHPGRKRNVKLSTEDECADALAAINFFIDRNKLDRVRIEKRQALKYKKFAKWWPFKRVNKKSSLGQLRHIRVSSRVK